VRARYVSVVLDDNFLSFEFEQFNNKRFEKFDEVNAKDIDHTHVHASDATTRRNTKSLTAGAKSKTGMLEYVLKSKTGSSVNPESLEPMTHMWVGGSSAEEQQYYYSVLTDVGRRELKSDQLGQVLMFAIKIRRNPFALLFLSSIPMFLLSLTSGFLLMSQHQFHSILEIVSNVIIALFGLSPTLTPPSPLPHFNQSCPCFCSYAYPAS
jgi:hypothetical protein